MYVFVSNNLETANNYQISITESKGDNQSTQLNSINLTNEVIHITINNKDQLQVDIKNKRSPSYKNMLIAAFIIAFFAGGAVLTYFGFMHLMHISYLDHAYGITPHQWHQLALQPLAFSAVVIGTTMMTMIATKLLVKLVQKLIVDKITKRLTKENDLSAKKISKANTNKKYLVLITAVTAIVTLVLLLAAAHAFGRINMDTYGGPYDVLISKPEFYTALAFGMSGAFTGGICIYTLARLVRPLFTPFVQHKRVKAAVDAIKTFSITNTIEKISDILV